MIYIWVYFNMIPDDMSLQTAKQWKMDIGETFELLTWLEKSLFDSIQFCTFVQQQSAKITKSSGDPY